MTPSHHLVVRFGEPGSAFFSKILPIIAKLLSGLTRQFLFTEEVLRLLLEYVSTPRSSEDSYLELCGVTQDTLLDQLPKPPLALEDYPEEWWGGFLKSRPDLLECQVLFTQPLAGTPSFGEIVIGFGDCPFRLFFETVADPASDDEKTAPIIPVLSFDMGENIGMIAGVTRAFCTYLGFAGLTSREIVENVLLRKKLDAVSLMNQGENGETFVKVLDKILQNPGESGVDATVGEILERPDMFFTGAAMDGLKQFSLEDAMKGLSPELTDAIRSGMAGIMELSVPASELDATVERVKRELGGKAIVANSLEEGLAKLKAMLGDSASSDRDDRLSKIIHDTEKKQQKEDKRDDSGLDPEIADLLSSL